MCSLVSTTSVSTRLDSPFWPPKEQHTKDNTVDYAVKEWIMGTQS